ncbi:hypothetical protein FQR65_LT17934 [Abscondita terminalis]|nr:hypothetical protein FQR65_LT17934 [Abscondita terminalis]
METLFDAFGIDSEDHSDNALILKPRMLDASFPLGDERKVHHLEAPAMVQGGIGPGAVWLPWANRVATDQNKALKPGHRAAGAALRSESVAPRALQLGRYLPPAALRCLLDAGGNDLAGGFTSRRSTTNWKACLWAQRQQVMPSPALIKNWRRDQTLGAKPNSRPLAYARTRAEALNAACRRHRRKELAR